MATGERAYKQLYLPAGSDWDTAIRRLAVQLRAGHPVLIWHGDGVLAFVCGDPDRNLMSPRWMARLLHTVAAEYLALSDGE